MVYNSKLPVISYSRKSYPTGRPKTTTGKNTVAFRPIPRFKILYPGFLYQLVASFDQWTPKSGQSPMVSPTPHPLPRQAEFSPFLPSRNSSKCPHRVAPSAVTRLSCNSAWMEQTQQRPWLPGSDQPPAFPPTYL